MIRLSPIHDRAYQIIGLDQVLRDVDSDNLLAFSHILELEFQRATSK